MAALSFHEKFKNKLSTVTKQGELSMSQARAVAGQLPDSKSHFKYAAAAMLQTKTPVPHKEEVPGEQERKEEFLMFAKPIRITRKAIGDTFSECAAPVRLMVADVAISETATVGNHKVSQSIDFQQPLSLSPHP
jgi:hypothetical protein